MTVLNYRRIRSCLPLICLTMTVTVLTGCSGKDSDSEPDSDTAGAAERAAIKSGADQMAGGTSPDVGADTFGPSPVDVPGDRPGSNELPPKRLSDPSQSVPPAPGTLPLAEVTPAPAGVPDTGGNSADVIGRELRDDLSCEELIRVLENADRDMQVLAGGRTQVKDPKQAGEMMKTLAKIKLQASVRLQGHPDATEDQHVEGVRGQLQALSHLAAMGDVASAKALEDLAKEKLTSDVPTVAGDSRIVLIGFAIDALQIGKESAADDIASLVEGMTTSPNSDVPAVLIMARARQVLISYGMIDQAARVRQKILALYGNSSDPMIAKVAADAAGEAKFDFARRLMAKIMESDEVALARWSDAVMELINDSPDMNTVQFLASSALQLEAANRTEFVKETFELLSEQFTDEQSASYREIQTAKNAMEARLAVLGSPFSFAELPTVNGEGVSPDEYKGKVVLMPFWAISIPESLQMVQMLKEIRDEYPDEIAIVGMNLDPEQAPLREFLAQNNLGFPSYRSVSSPTAEIANPIAAKFGLVSMPFVAIYNKQGKVEALDFTGIQLEAIVDQLTSAEAENK